jgi:DNA invertase Pin-like site-specific DNA recombinase
MKTTVLNIERAAPASSGKREFTAIAPTGAATGKLNVTAYARVSSDSEDQLNSYLSQMRHYANLITENPAWEYVDVYADEGLTGLDAAKRAGFQRMLRDCRRGKIDRILTKSVSRFARNLTDCLETIHELKRIGVTVLFEKEGIDTAKMSGETLLAMQAGAAQRESLSIAGNLRRGVRMRMKTGEFLPSSAPYGYKLNTQARTLEIVPEQAKVVRRIFTAYLAGQGRQDITDTLNREGVPKENQISPYDGKPIQWHPLTVRYILTNLSYTGDMIWQKRYTTDTLPFRLLRNDGKYPRYYVQNSHEPIISHEDFDRVQRLMAQRREKFRRRATEAESDAGDSMKKAVYCECGAPCRRKITNGKSYWVCQTHDNKGRHICPVSQAPEPEILAAFARMWEKLKRHRCEILEPLTEHLKLIADRKYKSDVNVAEVNKELMALAERVHVLEKLKSKEYLEPALYISQRGELDRRLTALRRVKERLMDEEHAGSATLVEDLTAALEGGAPDGEGFAEIVERVTVMAEDSLRFRLRCGLDLTEPIRRETR